MAAFDLSTSEARDAPRPQKKQGWECPAPTVQEPRVGLRSMPVFSSWKDWEDYKEWLQQQDGLWSWLTKLVGAQARAASRATSLSRGYLATVSPGLDFFFERYEVQHDLDLQYMLLHSLQVLTHSGCHVFIAEPQPPASEPAMDQE